MTLLRVQDLTISRLGSDAHIVRAASLAPDPGETLGIAGESGCGRSTLLLALLGIVKPGLTVTGGQMHLSGQDLATVPDDTMRGLRGRFAAMVPQSAAMALTPTMRVGAQLAEAMAVHDAIPPDAIAERTTALFARVRLPEPDRIGARYPHELSGGQMQRVAIAMALACGPKLLLLDEPTTGLDVTTQAGILDLLGDLRRETGMAMVCVSHDIGVLARLSARVAVMYAGRIVEERPTATLLTRPAHPYARALLASVPRIDSPGLPPSIPGSPPPPGMSGPGCAFAPRCSRAALRRVQVVFQNPDASLNSRHTVREILAQPLRLYFNASPTNVETRAHRLIADVRLDPAHLDRRPAQLSSGERQRVALARAFAAEPDVILCDEVTSALDVSVQARVLALIHDLCHAHGTSRLFVAHDIAVVAALCDRVAVLHQGRIVEQGPARSVCSTPEHPYTRSLVGAVHRIPDVHDNGRPPRFASIRMNKEGRGLNVTAL